MLRTNMKSINSDNSQTASLNLFAKRIKELFFYLRKVGIHKTEYLLIFGFLGMDQLKVKFH